MQSETQPASPPQGEPLALIKPSSALAIPAPQPGLRARAVRAWLRLRLALSTLAQRAARPWLAAQQGEALPAVPVALAPGWPAAADDPLLRHLLAHPTPHVLARIGFASPLLNALRADGVAAVAPLINSGHLVGVLALGPRKSDQPYTRSDRRLLATLADQVAPALHVTQLVAQRQRAALAGERLAQELRMAHDIQLSLLPKVLPQAAGWSFETLYQPARAVGGDFYDFIDLGGPPENRRLGVLIGDVTGKGMPAALIMATTRTVLRSVALGGAPPGALLQRANNLLVQEIAQGFFVTCLYAVIETGTGLVRFANAGHNPPFARHAHGVDKLDAVGMPLGLMADMEYDEASAQIEPGGCLLLYSDGITEAHNPARELFGFPRLHALLAQVGAAHGAAGPDNCPRVLGGLLHAVQSFTGPNAEQEDDITLLALHRLQQA